MIIDKEQKDKYVTKIHLTINIFFKTIILHLYTNNKMQLNTMKHHIDRLKNNNLYNDEDLKNSKKMIQRMENVLNILSNKPINSKIEKNTDGFFDEQNMKKINGIKLTFMTLSIDESKQLFEKKVVYNKIDRQLDNTLFSIVDYFFNYLILGIQYKKKVLLEYDLLKIIFKENDKEITFDQENQLESIKILLNMFLIKFEKINYIEFHKEQYDKKEYLTYLCYQYISKIEYK